MLPFSQTILRSSTSSHGQSGTPAWRTSHRCPQASKVPYFQHQAGGASKCPSYHFQLTCCCMLHSASTLEIVTFPCPDIYENLTWHKLSSPVRSIFKMPLPPANASSGKTNYYDSKSPLIHALLIIELLLVLSLISSLALHSETSVTVP